MINIEQWIESVREKPEHIRMRYVLGCVAGAMVLVVGVWLLSVSESFKTIADDSATEELNQVLPKPSDFSLDALVEGKQSLGTKEDPVSGEAFFQDQYPEKKDPALEDKSIQPKSNQER